VLESKTPRLLRTLIAVSMLCHCSSEEPRTAPNEGAGGEGGEGASAGADSSGEGGEAGALGTPNDSTGGTKNSGAAAGTSSSGGTHAGSAGAGASGAAGASGTAGAGGSPNDERPFMLGADISSVQEAVDGGASFVDTDGVSKGLLEILSNHGFNYIRLRTFVEPDALYGYANPTGEEPHKKAEPYCDAEHTLAVAQEVKQADMGLLLSLHYSDIWADPGKQIIPEAWRGVTTIQELATEVRTYTEGVVRTLVEGGARPDIVQLGNEIAGGLLIHLPADDPRPDQWGNMNMVVSPVNGSASNFDNLALLLKAGVAGVEAVDPTIEIMLHVETTQSFPAVRDWVNKLRTRGVKVDVVGLSCYPAYQGGPEIWEDTFQALTERLDGVSFVIAEYNPERTRANRIMRDLPDGRGLGTFFWEPTLGGPWGAPLFTFEAGAYRANEADFAEFDALRVELGL
jgi:arabinogalactan endo-1,4-beta-galactosidase